MKIIKNIYFFCSFFLLTFYFSSLFSSTVNQTVVPDDIEGFASSTYEKMRKAIVENDISQVKILLKNMSEDDVNLHNSYNMFFLHHAAKLGLVKITKLLIEARANVNVQDDLGRTPLFYALSQSINNDKQAKKQRDLINILLQAKADVNIADYYETTPLSVVLHLPNYYDKQKKQQEFIVDTLIKSGVNVNFKTLIKKTPLLMAIINKDPVMVEKLIKAGASVNEFDQFGCSYLSVATKIMFFPVIQVLLSSSNQVNAVDLNGMTPLFVALNCSIDDDEQKDRQESIVDALIQRGANVNVVNLERDTPLILTILNKNLLMVEKLITAGAQVNVCDLFGFSSLSIAIRTMVLPVIQALLKAGANVNAVEYKGMTPLLVAVALNIVNDKQKEEQAEIVDALIQRGAAVNVVNLEGNTPLILAILNKNLLMVKKLINAGAQVNVCDRFGYSSLSIAIRIMFLPVIQALLEAGFKVNTVEYKGVTPLFIAVALDIVNDKQKEEQEQIVDALIKYGANVNFINHEQRTPLIEAIFHRNLLMVEKLIAKGAQVDNPSLDGCTPLFIALKFNPKYDTLEELQKNDYYEKKIAIAEALIRHGADINHRNDTEQTPLNVIVDDSSREKNFIKVAKFLIEHDAIIDVCEEKGIRPIEFALLYNADLNMMSLLLNAGADIIKKNKHKDTLLHVAALTNKPEKVRLLLEYAEPSVRAEMLQIKNYLGNTPLHVAAQRGNEDVVKILLDCELALHKQRIFPQSLVIRKIKNLVGNTAIDVAANSSIKELIENYKFDR